MWPLTRCEPSRIDRFCIGIGEKSERSRDVVEVGLGAAEAALINLRRFPMCWPVRAPEDLVEVPEISADASARDGGQLHRREVRESSERET